MKFQIPGVANTAGVPQVGPDDSDGKHIDAEKTAAHATDHPIQDSDEISLDAQLGIQKIEATTKVWSKRDLILAYVFIWVIYFVDSMQQSVGFAMEVYVTSSFAAHSLTAATRVMSSLIGGLTSLPLAKILDIWGRPQGFAVMLFVLEMGLVMMAACQNVETYAAAQVFYWVGFNGLNYSMSIFVADTSALKNRGLMFAFISSPYIITTWIGGPLATSFLNGPGFRWGYGVFAIVFPVLCMPLFALFILNYRKAKKMGIMPVHNSGRTTLQSIKYYVIQFDLLGLLIIIAGFALFLLPFSLYSYQADTWRSALVVSMLVIGGLLLILFPIYEKYWAPVTLIPFDLLTDRTVLGACILAASLFVSFYIWDSYFISFLQVVQGVSITDSSYIANIYSIGSCFWALVVGFFIRATGRFKYLALVFGLPLNVLGIGLMIAFRQPDVNIGYIVMCQIFIAFAGGTLVICEQIAAMAATTHQYIAVVLALESLFSRVGGAIGQTVAAAVWTGVFPARLAEYLPPEAQANLTLIYGDITQQMSYPQGSPTRIAINRAYGEAQKMMLIGGTAILALGFVGIFMWRDIKVKDFKQVKGRVV